MYYYSTKISKNRKYTNYYSKMAKPIYFSEHGDGGFDLTSTKGSAPEACISNYFQAFADDVFITVYWET